jgi:uncharacterized coiled-coil DUF342 family protein
VTSEQQEMLRAAIVALDEENTTIRLDPNDVIELLRRVEELEREAAFADKKLEHHVARIKKLMDDADAAEKAWQTATGRGYADDARERIAALETRVEEMRRRYQPTMAEQCEDMDAQAGACWG